MSGAECTIAFAAGLSMSGCGAFTQRKRAPRSVVTPTREDVREGDADQTGKPANIDCIPGRRVVLAADLTGNLVPLLADSLVAEALCGEVTVADVTLTAQPPPGFDTDRAADQRTEGVAVCQVSWAFMPNPNRPVWQATCTFY